MKTFMPAAPPERKATPSGKPKLTKQDFVAALEELFAKAAKAGSKSVDIKAAALHTLVGVYPSRGHSMPTCCTVMCEAMQPADQVLTTPPGGKGATLEVRYRLPR